MGNITGPINSAGGEVITSAALSVAIKDFITSASASVLVSTLTANFITSASASTMITSFNYITSALASTTYAQRNDVIQIASAATGGTININDATDVLIVNASSLAVLNINLPTSANTGKTVRIASKDTVVALSVSGAGILNALTAFTAGGFVAYTYTGTLWIRTG